LIEELIPQLLSSYELFPRLSCRRFLNNLTLSASASVIVGDGNICQAPYINAA